MVTLYHYSLCPLSRFARLVLGEYGITPELIEEKPFERRLEFLHIDSAGQTPVIVEDSGTVLAGANPITEYFDETIRLESGREVNQRHAQYLHPWRFRSPGCVSLIAQAA